VTTDRQLLAAWADGDQAAGQRLFQRHFDAVHRFMASKVDRGLDDLLQRTFEAALKARQRWPDDAGFRPYLLGIARNVLRRHFRERDRDQRVFDPLETSVALLGASPSTMIGAREEVRVLFEAMRRLPLDLQIALELHYWEAMPAAQIAWVLEIAEGTVRTRLARAKQLLRHELEHSPERSSMSVSASVEHWAAALAQELAKKP
jgi:RNA polymerase sigma-70 factor (ECF subfamily)